MTQSNTATVVYYILIVFSYLWAGVQLVAGEPFDCLVLFAVTFMFQNYRNENRRLHGTK